VNPYRLFLGDQRAVDVIQETPRRLRELAGELGEDGLEESFAPGKWSARQVICHLADVEIAFAFRLRQAAAEEHHMIQPFDQDLWAAPYRKLDVEAALNTFAAVRDWNLLFIGAIPAEMLRKPVSHPERGQMTMETILETMGGHDRNHLEQLETVRSQRMARG
jgi:hypothetical protein